MYAIDFRYDGEYLSDKGFIICRVGSFSDIKTVGVGSNIEIETIPNMHGTKNYIVNAKYNDCLSTTFQICKNCDLYEDLSITEYEVRDIARWLNRKEFLDTSFYSESGECVGGCHFDASFNVTKLEDDNATYALELEMITNSPFAHGEKEVLTYDIKSPNKVISITDNSDEIGYSYPVVKIDVKQAGNLKVTNKFTGDVVLINNCKVGEKIELSGSSQIITTSLSSHKICNDFNFNFLRIGNSYSNRINEIIVSIPCTLTIETIPIIKNSPM